MMHDLLLDALLLMLLWLYVILLSVWPRCQATTSQADRQSAKRSMRRLQGPKPFPGLTTKPRCPAAAEALEEEVKDAPWESGPGLTGGRRTEP